MAEQSAPKTKQTPDKTTVVGGKVVLVTKTFDPMQPLLLDQAAEAFKKQVAETHGDKAVTNVSVRLGKHHVGQSVSYDVTGEVAG